MRDARERICEAMLDLASAEDYEAIQIEDVVERAGASREDFDRIFSSKEDCAIAVFDRFIEDFNREVDEAYSSEEKWPDSLRAAAYAFASWMKEHPREVRLGGVGLLWAGELAQARREAAFQRFVGMVDAGREGAENPDSIPAFTAERVIGSIAEITTKRLQHGGIDGYEFLRETMYLAVLPYRGEEAAARELTMPPRLVDGD